MFRFGSLWGACILVLFFTGVTTSQTHFTFTSSTGNDATVAIPTSANPNINGTSLANGDEIGAFTPAGLCVGAVVWSATNTALTVWGDNDLTPAVDGMAAGEQISYRVWDQSSNTEYTTVNVTYSQGDGNYSANALYVLSSLSAVTPPAAPALTSPSNGATGVAINPTLNWASSTGATSYGVQVSISPSFSSTVVNQTGITTTSYGITGLTNNTTYYWRVNASNAAGTSAWSSSRSFTTIVAAPSAPTLSSPANGATGVATNPTLSWNASTGAASYGLQVSTSSGFSTTVVNQTGITTTSSAVSGLTNNTTYYWRVNATNAGGTSAWSSSRSFTTIVATPSAPTLSSPANGATGVATNPSLNWNASTGASSYGLQVSTNSSFFTTVVNETGITTTSYAASGFANNTTYYWRVNASNAGGTSGWSSSRNFTTVVAAPSPPTLSSPESGTTGVATNPTLNWNTAAGATSYRLQVSTSSSFFTTAVNQASITTTSYAVSGLTNNTTYYWRVNATNAGGTSAYSDVWNFTTNISHGIVLPQGWNMISSVVQPRDSTLDTVLAKIIPHMVLLKNGAGEVFWPAEGIDAIANWNYREGYQLYMQSADTLTVSGTEVVPETTSLSLAQGVNLVPYLRYSAMRADSALVTVQSNLLIAKNNAGEVYWPAYGINAIGSLKPGQGYQLQVTQATTLTYPANAGSFPPSLLTKSQTFVQLSDVVAPEHYVTSVSKTGTNAVLLVEEPNLKERDEIAVWTASKMLIGSGVISRGRALITIWGDNKATENVIDGAAEGEPLSLTVWSITQGSERPLVLSAISDAVTGTTSSPPLRYRTNAVWTAQAVQGAEMPQAFALSQNYPNPFNPSSTIRYGLPQDAMTTLEVFNILGQRVAVLVNEEQKAGYHEVTFQNQGLGSGIYFYRLTAGKFSETRKMTLLR
jgi:hypothetical protein